MTILFHGLVGEDASRQFGPHCRKAATSPARSVAAA